MKNEKRIGKRLYSGCGGKKSSKKKKHSFTRCVRTRVREKRELKR